MSIMAVYGCVWSVYGLHMKTRCILRNPKLATRTVLPEASVTSPGLTLIYSQYIGGHRLLYRQVALSRRKNNASSGVRGTYAVRRTRELSQE